MPVGVLPDLDKPNAQGGVVLDPFDPFKPATQIVFPENNINFRSIEEIPFQRKGTPFSASGVRSYVRKFRVMVKNRLLGPEGVCRCPGVPLPFATYVPNRDVLGIAESGEVDLKARCVQLDADGELPDDWQPWIVTASYSTEMPPGGPIKDYGLGGELLGPQNYPELEPPVLRWETETVQYAFPKDLDGKAFITSAQQPYSPPPTFEVDHPVLVITKNDKMSFPSMVRERIEDFSGVVNSEPFCGAQPGFAFCKITGVDEMYRGPTRYWRFTYRIRFKKRVDLGNGFFDTWQPQILDQGTYQYRTLLGAAVPGTLVPIFSKFGVAVSTPVLLDGFGRQGRPGLDGKILPKYNSFRVYRSVNLNDLLLDAANKP